MLEAILNWVRVSRAPVTMSAYMEGHAAEAQRRAGNPYIRNPHPRGSFDSMLWHRGRGDAKAAWAQAW